MPNAFAPFDYGQVAGNVEAIKGARTRNALAQQQLDPNSPQNQLMQAQLTGVEQGNVLAQQQGQRAQGTFDQQQRRANSEFAYEAFTVMSQNPEAVNYYGPKLKEMGIIPPETDWSNATPEETMSFAEKQSQALGQALGKGAKGEGPAAVQEYRFFQDLTPENKEVFMQIKRAQPNAKFLDTGPTVEVLDPVTGDPITSINKGLAPEAAAAGEIAAAKETGKLEVQRALMPQVRSAIKVAETEAKDKGEQLSSLNRAKAALPGLMEVTDKLKKLSEVATYTKTGQAFDIMSKELGFGATKGATARAKVRAIVDNQVLPLLRDTFGAAFTKAEGDSLRDTLLDVNATPEAKKATLDSFIEQKMRNIETMQREVGAPQAPSASQDMSIDDLVNQYAQP